MRTTLRLLLVLFPVVASAASIDTVMSRDRQDREAYRAARSSSRFATQAITTVGSDSWLLIPAAGNLQGNFGTYYKSDVMITNHRSTPQLIDVSFFQQGQNGVSGFALKRITIPPTTGIPYDDMIGKTLGKTGFGTLDFRARMSDGSLDTSAKIDVFSRIWTPMANAAGTIFAGGTTSQSFPGIRVDSLDGTPHAYLLGLQQDSQFRTNVGIYNYDTSNAHTFTVNVHGSFGDTSTTVTVPAWSIVQTSIPAGNWGPLFLVVIPDSGMTSQWWAAYASSSDNKTGDGWISIGSQND